MNEIVAASAMGGGGLIGLLITFIILIIVLVIVGGLMAAIETYIMKQQIPPMIKLVIGLIMVLFVIIWAIQAFTGMK